MSRFFVKIWKCTVSKHQLPGIDTVRTLKKRRINKKAAQRFLRDSVAPIDLEPRRDEILANIKKLQEMFDPQEEIQKAA